MKYTTINDHYKLQSASIDVGEGYLGLLWSSQSNFYDDVAKVVRKINKAETYLGIEETTHYVKKDVYGRDIPTILLEDSSGKRETFRQRIDTIRKLAGFKVFEWKYCPTFTDLIENTSKCAIDLRQILEMLQAIGRFDGADLDAIQWEYFNGQFKLINEMGGGVSELSVYSDFENKYRLQLSGDINGTFTRGYKWNITSKESIVVYDEIHCPSPLETTWDHGGAPLVILTAVSLDKYKFLGKSDKISYGGDKLRKDMTRYVKGSGNIIDLLYRGGFTLDDFEQQHIGEIQIISISNGVDLEGSKTELLEHENLFGTYRFGWIHELDDLYYMEEIENTNDQNMCACYIDWCVNYNVEPATSDLWHWWVCPEIDNMEGKPFPYHSCVHKPTEKQLCYGKDTKCDEISVSEAPGKNGSTFYTADTLPKTLDELRGGRVITSIDDSDRYVWTLPTDVDKYIGELTLGIGDIMDYYSDKYLADKVKWDDGVDEPGYKDGFVVTSNVNLNYDDSLCCAESGGGDITSGCEDQIKIPAIETCDKLQTSMVGNRNTTEGEILDVGWIHRYRSIGANVWEEKLVSTGSNVKIGYDSGEFATRWLAWDRCILPDGWYKVLEVSA